MAKRRQQRLPLWLALAGREIRNAPVFSAVFALSVSLGLTGFLVLEAFRTSLSTHLDERSRAMLGADLSVFGDRPLTEAESKSLTDLLPPGSRERHETSMLSMVAHGNLSRLTQVVAVDRDYPFYGTVGLRQGGEVGAGWADALEAAPRAWVYPELLAQLDAKIGDTVRLGAVDFQIVDVIDRDPTVASVGLEIAPKMVIASRFLAGAELLGKGSRVFRSTLIALPGAAPDVDAVALKLRQTLPRGELRIRTHRAASTELYRALLHLSDFLGLVALVALFLAGVGSAYLFRSFLGRRVKDVAILRSLGVGAGTARGVYVAQLTLLGAGATVLTAVFAALLLPLIPTALGDLMPQELTPRLSAVSLALALAMGVGGSLLACLPLLAGLGAVSPASLFQEGASPRLTVGARQGLWWLPALSAFWGLAVVTARSWRTGSLFTGIFLGAALVFGLAAFGLMAALRRVSWRRTPMPLALASMSLARHRAATLASFMALGLGALLLNLVPQIRAVLAAELSRPTDEPTPSLFLFDIQEEQIGPLTAHMTASGTPLVNVSPMVRARLTAIDGKAASTAVAEGAPPANADDGGDGGDGDGQRALNRGYNLSYRAGLTSSETLTEGKPMAATPPASGQPAELSLEARFAERLGLHVGSRLTFDVQGVPVDGVVVNTRQVRWTSFQPNFFVEVQPGVLDDAPKTFVAAMAGLSQEQKLAAQRDLGRTYANISVIDVAATIARLLGIVAQMERALVLMAALALIAGLAVLFAIARYQALSRLPDVTLLKVLGAPFGTLLAMATLEFTILGAAAAALGAVLGIGGAFILASVLFDRLWVFSWQAPLVAAGALTALTTVVGLVAVGRSLMVSPLTILQGPADS